MNVVNPTYLWGLLAVLVPLAIHLLNRGDVRTIKVGSIKFLRAQETKQTKNIKLNELLLLLLRILIVVLLVFVLAIPKIEAKKKNSDIVYLIEPSLLGGNLLDSYLNTLPEEAQIHLLSLGFPEFDENESTSSTKNTLPNYWQLVHDMNQLKADKIVVFSESLTKGIKGMRPSTATDINWVVVNDDPSINKWIGANELGNDVQLVKLNSNSQITAFETSWVPKMNQGIVYKGDSLIVKSEQEEETFPIHKLDTLTIGIFHNEDFSREAIYFEKAFQAISAYLERPISVKTGTAYGIMDKADVDLLVWFLPNEIPKTNVKRIRYEADSLAASILIEGRTKNDFLLTQRLDIESILEGKLTQKLIKVLDFSPNFSSEVELHDKRVMPLEEIQPLLANTNVGKKKVQVQMLDISNWLWLFLVLVLVVERLLAKFRKQ